MCGRYFIDINEKELRDIISKIEKNSTEIYKTDEIFPTNVVPIVTKYGCILAKWGFPKRNYRGVIINARVESLSERSMFKNLVNTKRCIIPASAYFEWKKNDNNNIKKYKLKNLDSILYIAGLYDTFSESSKQLSLFEDNSKQDFLAFTIITKEANDYVSSIHNRMPLICSKEEMSLWLNGYDIDALVSQNNYALTYSPAD